MWALSTRQEVLYVVAGAGSCSWRVGSVIFIHHWTIYTRDTHVTRKDYKVRKNDTKVRKWLHMAGRSGRSGDAWGRRSPGRVSCVAQCITSV